MVDAQWQFDLIETTKIHGVNSPTPTQTASSLALSHPRGQRRGYFIHVLSGLREDGVFNDPAMVVALTSQCGIKASPLNSIARVSLDLSA